MSTSLLLLAALVLLCSSTHAHLAGPYPRGVQRSSRLSRWFSRRPSVVHDGIVCPAVWQPVCCGSATGQTTESNECYCTAKGGKKLYDGKCGEVACPAVWDPVCCISPAGQTTEGNGCNCIVKGGKKLYDGKCKPCACPRNYDPVCCRSAGFEFTTSNSCGCDCAGGSVISSGMCPHDIPALPPTPGEGCGCITLWDPVCCGLEGSKTEVVSNSCVCKCKGGALLKPGACSM